MKTLSEPNFVSRFYRGHWLRLAISWKFWAKYGGRRIKHWIEVEEVYSTMG